MQKFQKLAREELQVKIKAQKSGHSGFPPNFIEHRNFLKLASNLVDYGFICSWLPVDDGGADFICIHIRSARVIKVQQKGRITINEKYYGKDLYMAFPMNDEEPDKNWVVVSHDELIPLFDTPANWKKNKGKHASKVSAGIWDSIVALSIVEPINFD